MHFKCHNSEPLLQPRPISMAAFRVLEIQLQMQVLGLFLLLFLITQCTIIFHSVVIGNDILMRELLLLLHSSNTNAAACVKHVSI